MLLNTIAEKHPNSFVLLFPKTRDEQNRVRDWQVLNTSKTDDGNNSNNGGSSDNGNTSNNGNASASDNNTSSGNTTVRPYLICTLLMIKILQRHQVQFVSISLKII